MKLERGTDEKAELVISMVVGIGAEVVRGVIEEENKESTGGTEG